MDTVYARIGYLVLRMESQISPASCPMSIMYWAADQKFLSSNILVTKTSSACKLARELRSTKLVILQTYSVSLFPWTHVANNEWAPDLTIVTYFLSKLSSINCLSFVINIIGLYHLYYNLRHGPFISFLVFPYFS